MPTLDGPPESNINSVAPNSIPSPQLAPSPPLPPQHQLLPHPPNQFHTSFPQSSPIPTPLPRRLAPRQQQFIHTSSPTDSQQERMHQTQYLSHLGQNRSPSPSTAAAAISLGALAAAASVAAASVPTNPTHSTSYSLTHMPPPNVTGYTRQPSHTRQDQAQLNASRPVNSQADAVVHSVTQSLSNFPLVQHPTEPPLPPVFKKIPTTSMGSNPMAHSKSTPKPVAPAPTHAMHPSQQHLPNTHPNGKPKQRRYRATPEQLRQLIARFDLNPSPSSAELQELALKITMPTQSVVLWFKNRRARVPHKKAEKALNAKRRESGEHSASSGGIVKPAKGAQKKTSPVKKEDMQDPIKGSPSFTEEAAAASMAEMALALAAGQASDAMQDCQANCNVVKQGPLTTVQVQPLSIRSASASPPPVYRPKAENVVPYDSNLVKRLGGKASENGAEFVQASTTPRRPRKVPPTPRLFSQKEYGLNERVEVLEKSKGICRAWYSATIVGRGGPRELSLGANAAMTDGLESASGTSNSKPGEQGEHRREDDEENTDGNDSPRTVRSPAASPTPPIAKIRYTVEYEHRFEEGDDKKPLREDLLASSIRPAAPFTIEKETSSWRPEAGEAVEVLREGAWFVAVVQNFIMRKGHMVSFESGDVEWVRRQRIRPYQVWKGGESWVTKKKPPLPVVRKSVGLRVTHPPGGKRKRIGENGKERETRGRSKRSKSLCMDGSGPDGLPEGWRVDQVRSARLQKLFMVYVAPDGHRLRSLKEAQKYVRMMGPA